MTLCIADGLFVITFIGELPPHFTHAPIVVRDFLDPFDPVVGHTHTHSEVKADTSHLNRSGKTSHSADIFCNCKRILVNLMDEDVRQCKISDGIRVHSLVEVVLISHKVLLKAMIPIEHAGHTIETESVHIVLFHPVLTVGQKEVFRLVLSIIEASRAPGRMMALPAVVEVKGLLSVEKTKAFRLIVNRMRVNDIHDYSYSETMRIIHKSLELLRGSEA